MAQANAICENLDSHPNVGVALDVYHTWWDDKLKEEIFRSFNNGNLTSYHICDWLSPMEDMLNDRGLMGEGSINVNQISKWGTESGFTGFHEVEIFSERWWKIDQHDYLNKIISYFE